VRWQFFITNCVKRPQRPVSVAFTPMAAFRAPQRFFESTLYNCKCLRSDSILDTARADDLPTGRFEREHPGLVFPSRDTLPSPGCHE
jgi:hypothetical protein